MATEGEMQDPSSSGCSCPEAALMMRLEADSGGWSVSWVLTQGPLFIIRTPQNRSCLKARTSVHFRPCPSGHYKQSSLWRGARPRGPAHTGALWGVTGVGAARGEEGFHWRANRKQAGPVGQREEEAEKMWAVGEGRESAGERG